ncbi:MAG: type IV pilus biogenesis/stability protein PilW [Gammaproteobacteria bacterium]|nr:MAG: type IV pilus biogenesis/stability protein PilW [Gammaproteobacteria bacterium]
MVKFFSKNSAKILAVVLINTLLSACVTQQYKDDNTLVITNQANNKEIAMTRIQLGLGYLNIGNTTQAKLNLEKAKRSAPNLVQVHTAFAHYYDRVGEVDLAISSYEKALSLQPDDADTLNNYGVFLCRQGRTDEAEKQLLKAIAIPTYLLVSKSYNNIALCQLKNKNFEKAEQYLKKSIEHNPNNVAALVNMAQLQYAKRDYNKAVQNIKRFEKATRRFQPQPLALAFKVYKKQGKHKIANNYAAMLVKMFPQSYLTKQYLVNELSHIEADTWAEQYQLSIKTHTLTTGHKKKRVIKLSPHKPMIAFKKTPVKAVPVEEIARKEAVSKEVVNQTTSLVAADQTTEEVPAIKTSNNKVVVKKVTDTRATNAADQTTEEVPAIKTSNNKVVVKKVTDTRATNADDQTTEEVPAIKTSNNKVVVKKVTDTRATKIAAIQMPPVTAKENTSVVVIVEESQHEVSQDKVNKAVKQQVNKEQQSLTLPVHVIGSGESLFFVSKKYNIKMPSLKRWNHLKKNPVLHVGDVIYLSDPKKSVASANN